MSVRPARLAVPFILAAIIAVACTRPVASSAGMPGESQPGNVCVHLDFPWSDWECTDTNSTRQFMNMADAESVMVVVKTKQGTIRVTPVSPRADAIFLTKRAGDSIFVRYYQTVGDQAKAQALANRLKTLP